MLFPLLSLIYSLIASSFRMSKPQFSHIIPPSHIRDTHACINNLPLSSTPNYEHVTYPVILRLKHAHTSLPLPVHPISHHSFLLFFRLLPFLPAPRFIEPDKRSSPFSTSFFHLIALYVLHLSSSLFLLSFFLPFIHPFTADVFFPPLPLLPLLFRPPLLSNKHTHLPASNKIKSSTSTGRKPGLAAGRVPLTPFPCQCNLCHNPYTTRIFSQTRHA